MLYIHDNMSYYFSKILKYTNQTSCYDQFYQDEAVVCAAATLLSEYKAGNATQQDFTDLCADTKCGEATYRIL